MIHHPHVVPTLSCTSPSASRPAYFAGRVPLLPGAPAPCRPPWCAAFPDLPVHPQWLRSVGRLQAVRHRHVGGTASQFGSKATLRQPGMGQGHLREQRQNSQWHQIEKRLQTSQAWMHVRLSVTSSDMIVVAHYGLSKFRQSRHGCSCSTASYLQPAVMAFS
eukprot:1156888-Pelagomonas_calceolata.AAC.4